MFEPPPYTLPNLTTRWLGQPLFFTREVDSTNRLLREMAREGATSGTVILTEYQHLGRGRQGRGWNAPPGSSLLLSILLPPPTSSERYPLLPLVLAVAVARTLENHLALEPAIKWPNDVLLGQRKCCGILVESDWTGNVPTSVVAGIGLNVNQEVDAFETLPEATSLRLVRGTGVERGPLLAELLNETERTYDTFQKGWEPHEAWRKRATLLGQPILVQPAQGAPWRATALDLSPDGRLLVQREDGQQEQVLAADVSIRFEP
ncbi:MAG: biotin--[acetyl-CoA-carboxylase] ligase [Ardenticatenales bacterium]|nr:biotin--[acetyl-CoA-carboxylase] ligase [Ardenticatenales bacterium]